MADQWCPSNVTFPESTGSIPCVLRAGHAGPHRNDATIGVDRWARPAQTSVFWRPLPDAAGEDLDERKAAADAAG